MAARLGGCAIGLALWVGAEGAARATEADSVTLQDGTELRGTLTEVAPNDHVTVVVGGESRTYQWVLVRRAARDGKVVVNNPAATVVKLKDPPAAAGEEQVVVHLDGEDDAVLEMKSPSSNAFVTVCHAPCDRAVPLDRLYRINGEGIRASRTFKLAGAANKPVVLDVNAAHSGAFVGGIVMTSVGPLALITGLTLYLAASIRIYGSTAVDPSLKTAGGVAMLAGAALTAVGVPLLVSNARTKVTQEIGRPARRDDDALLRVRLPERGRDVAHDVPMPAAAATPLLTATF